MGPVKIREVRQGNRCTELDGKYFCKIKFSTQVLISVWKIVSHCQLTALASTCCSGLHNFSALDFFHAERLERRWGKRHAQSMYNQVAASMERGKFCGVRVFRPNFYSSKQINTTSAVSRGAL